MRRPSRRLWSKWYTNRELKEIMKSKEIELEETEPVAEHVSARRIRDLSLLVNTGGYYKPEE